MLANLFLLLAPLLGAVAQTDCELPPPKTGVTSLIEHFATHRVATCSVVGVAGKVVFWAGLAVNLSSINQSYLSASEPKESPSPLLRLPSFHWLKAVELFVGCSRVQSVLGLDGKVFVFPTTSDTDYVLLKPTLELPLQRLTLCLSFFTDLERSFSLFSAASQRQDNEILFFFISPNKYEVCVGGSCTTSLAPRHTDGSGSHWEAACVTWESATGIVQVWANGQPLPRKGVARGHQIPTDLVVMLGQEQDSYGGSLQASQSFVGEMAEFYMWDTVLPPEQLRRIRRDSMPTPLLDWTALKYEIKGQVTIEPALQ